MALLPRTSTKPAPTRGPVFCGVFRPISASKVHSLDPQHLFRPHFGFEGPSTGPSAAFSASFRLRRSIPWTISTCFVLIPASKVHSLDPQHLFRPHFGFEGPFSGPSAPVSSPFRLRRSIPWTLSTCFVLISASKVHSLDPQRHFRPPRPQNWPFLRMGSGRGTATGTVWAENAPLAGRKVRQCYVLPIKV